MISKNFKTGGTQLFQPTIPVNSQLTIEKTYEELKDLYNTQYVRENSLDFEKGKGAIFRRHRNELVRYPLEGSIEWIPKVEYPRGVLLYETGLLAGKFLKELFERTSNLSMGRKSEED